MNQELRHIAAFLLLFVCFCSAATAQEKFSRNIENISFVPKGQWIGGVSVNYSQSDQNN